MKTTSAIKKKYDQLFRKNPKTANLFLLLAEIADKKGQVKLETPFPEAEIQRLMAARFDDPRRYSL